MPGKEQSSSKWLNMLKNPIEIKPYISVGPLHFGMSKEEVLPLLSPALATAPATATFDKNDNLTTLYWMESGLQTVFEGKDGPLVMVSLYANISPIFFQEVELIWDESSKFFQRIFSASREVHELAGVTVFLDLGLSTVGLESNDNSTKSVTAFSRGTWDDTLGAMRRLK